MMKKNTFSLDSVSKTGTGPSLPTYVAYLTGFDSEIFVFLRIKSLKVFYTSEPVLKYSVIDTPLKN